MEGKLTIKLYWQNNHPVLEAHFQNLGLHPGSMKPSDIHAWISVSVTLSEQMQFFSWVFKYTIFWTILGRWSIYCKAVQRDHKHEKVKNRCLTVSSGNLVPWQKWKCWQCDGCVIWLAKTMFSVKAKIRSLEAKMISTKWFFYSVFPSVQHVSHQHMLPVDDFHTLFARKLHWDQLKRII